MAFSPLLTLHISAGMVGMFSGTAAMIFRKGSPRHEQAGKVFVASMLTMAATATWLAFLKHQSDNVGGGIITFYLIATAWLTARRRDGETSIWDWVALVVPLWGGIGGWIKGMQAVRGHTGLEGLPLVMTFFMGSVMLLAAAGDIRMLARHGVFGTQRLVRHLWRMCFGLFIATGSFFLGQGSNIFPSIIKQSDLLLIPALLPLVLLVFWFFRVRFSSAYKSKPAAAMARGA